MVRSERPLCGDCRTAALWQPFLVGFRKGPSQWAPRDSEPCEGLRGVPEGPRKRSTCRLMYQDYGLEELERVGTF